MGERVLPNGNATLSCWCSDYFVIAILHPIRSPSLRGDLGKLAKAALQA
nr:hypothetical protein JVH1_5540 [Rhodococcus sp. JVH1]